MDDRPPIVIGAGPAGSRAAETLAAAGLAPIVIDEAPASGGQIYRRAPAGFTRPYRALYGFDAAKARRAARGVRRHQRQHRLPAGYPRLGSEARCAALSVRRAKSGGSVSRRHPGARCARPDHPVSGLDASRHLHAGRRADRVEVPGLRHRQRESFSWAPGRCSISSPTNTPRRAAGSPPCSTPRPSPQNVAPCPACCAAGAPSPRACGTWRHCAPAASSWPTASGRSRPRGRTRRLGLRLSRRGGDANGGLPAMPSRSGSG